MKNTSRIIVVLMALIVALLTVPVSGEVKTVKAQLRPDITFTVDGKEQTIKNSDGDVIAPLVYDGQVYIPASVVKKLTGESAKYDKKTNSLVVGEAAKAASTSSTSNVVYSDSKVSITFVECNKADSVFKGMKGFSNTYSEAKFKIKNKTNNTLMFIPGAFSFNGNSYQFLGSCEVAAKGTGTATFYTWDADINGSKITKTSGSIRVIDPDEMFSESYEAEWSNVAVK